MKADIDSIASKQFIYKMGENKLKSLIEDIDAKLQEGSQVYLDSTAFPWIDDYLKSIKSKQINTLFVNKANFFYEEMLSLINRSNDAENKICMPQKVKDDLMNKIDSTIEDIDYFGKHKGKELQELGRIMNTYKTCLDKIKCEEDPIAGGIEDLLCRLKEHFKWGERLDKDSKARDRILNLIAHGFAKAIRQDKCVYIVTEHADIEMITENLYGMLVCGQINLPQKLLERMLPMNIKVIATNGDGGYRVSFDSSTIAVGKNYDIYINLRQYGRMGSEVGSKAITKVVGRTIPDKVRKGISALTSLIPRKQELKAQEPVAAEHDSTDEAEDYIADALAGSLESQAQEPMPAEHLGHSKEPDQKIPVFQEAQCMPEKAKPSQELQHPPEAPKAAQEQVQPAAQLPVEIPAAQIQPAKPAEDAAKKQLPPMQKKPEAKPLEDIASEQAARYRLDNVFRVIEATTGKNILSIIKDYAIRTYAESIDSSKERAVSALKEMGEYFPDFKKDIKPFIRNLKKREIESELKKVNEVITKLEKELECITDVRDWYKNNDNVPKVNELTTKLTEQRIHKAMIQDKERDIE